MAGEAKQEGQDSESRPGKAEDPRSSSRVPSQLFRQAGRASIRVTRIQQTLGGSPDRQVVGSQSFWQPVTEALPWGLGFQSRMPDVKRSGKSQMKHYSSKD